MPTSIETPPSMMKNHCQLHSSARFRQEGWRVWGLLPVEACHATHVVENTSCEETRNNIADQSQYNTQSDVEECETYLIVLPACQIAMRIGLSSRVYHEDVTSQCQPGTLSNRKMENTYSK